jgi:Tol biopolymer transport system component
LITDVDSNITFSPDGRELAYELWNPPSNSMTLKIANADGTGERVLAVIHDTSFLSPGGPGPSWSPDGRTIVLPKQMIKGAYRLVLFTVSVSDGGVRQLYAGSEELGRVVWHPSGDHLLLQKFDLRSRRAQLWTVSFPEGVMRRLTHDTAEYWQDLDSTRDGKTLAAIAAASRTQVWASNGPNFTVAEPITPPDPPMVWVKVNKHGKLFAKDLAGYLWTMNPDRTALTKFAGVHDVDVIEPCGDFIVYSSSNDNSDVLMRVDADGTHPTKLVSGKLFSPSCASDGKFIYGRFLAYPYSTYYTAALGDHYAVIKASDGTLVKSFDMAREKFDNGPYWSADGKYLQFVATRSGVSNLWQHPLEGGPARQLTHFTSDEIFDFSWAPDGARLFLTRGKVSADVVLLTGLQ